MSHTHSLRRVDIQGAQHYAPPVRTNITFFVPDFWVTQTCT